MAVNIPSTAVRQPSDVLKNESTGITSYVYAWKGPYSDIQSCARSISQGDVYDGKTVATWDVQRIPGEWALLTINLTDSSNSSTSQLAPLIERWSVKSCRNDVSILAYCGSDDDTPNRTWIECWQRENDADVARSGNYTKPDGTVSDLAEQEHSAATSELMAKIEAGVESVIRFYPMVTRRRVYSTMPSTCLENLGYIDTPTIGSDAKHPGNLASKISQYQWLKVQDDAEQTSANEWTRTESWMGIKKASSSDSPWDEDLYGEERWPMPYHHSDSSGGAS